MTLVIKVIKVSIVVESLFKLRESDEVGMYITYISVLIFISVLVHFFFYIFQLKIDIIVQFVRLF